MALASDEEDLAAFIGRQPIFDRRMRVYAYELLYRSGLSNSAQFVDGDQATAQILVDSFMEIGLDAVVGNRKAFINVTRDFILGRSFHLFPPERVCIEILEDVHVDSTLMAEARHLREMGYTIALDDFVCDKERMALTEIADIVKLDIMMLGMDGLREHVKLLEGASVKLLAEKVETMEEFEFCKELGFAYFQGYFLQRPQIVQGRRMAADRVTMMELLARINDDEVTMDELEKIIVRDASLSYLLLRYINSALYALPGKIESLQHALMLLGTNAVKRWVNLLILAKISRNPNELLVFAMLRARMCEKLAHQHNSANPNTYFTAGLFSILEALMQRPMTEVISNLSLCESLKEALLHRSGPMGMALSCTIAYERGDWDEVESFGFHPNAVREAWIDAVTWVSSVRGQIPGHAG